MPGHNGAGRGSRPRVPGRVEDGCDLDDDDSGTIEDLLVSLDGQINQDFELILITAELDANKEDIKKFEDIVGVST